MPRYRLLTDGARNTKLAKNLRDKWGDPRKIVCAGLFMAPANTARRDANLCPAAGYCQHVCDMRFSGRMATGVVQTAMIQRALLYLDQHPLFLELLRKDLHRLINAGVDQGARPLCRLNGSTDLDWGDLATDFPAITFYDYTKRECLIRAMVDDVDWPANYELTYSVSERSNPGFVTDVLAAGHNVAVTFSTPYNPQRRVCDDLPSQWNDYPVVDGDEHDIRLREYDGRGVVVGLRFKGPRRRMQAAIKAGFVIEAGGSSDDVATDHS